MRGISTMVMAFIALSGLWTGAVFAHSELSSSTPADETVLQATPAAFAGLMALAVWNKYRLGPAIARGDSGAVVAFRRVVGVEWLMIAGVLILTSVMTGLYGPN